MPSPLEATSDLLRYIDASPSPFHAVRETRLRLEAAGYRELDELSPWSVTPGDRVFVVRNGASLVAFQLGTESWLDAGARIVGAHTDSPNLRIKPSPDGGSAGCAQLAVEPYGGVLLHTWLDRDLGLAGRAMVRRGDRIESCLVDLRTPIARIPSLAIHLNRGVNTEGLIVQPQKHLPPIHALMTSSSRDFRSLLGSSLSVEANEVLAWDVTLVDVQPSSLLGANQEFVSAARLDNLASCHASVVSLLDLANDARITAGIALFDHEECGSKSAHGAGGSFLRDVLVRLLAASGHESLDALPRAMAKSFLVSADMAHALHPNHEDKHEPKHAPLLGAGPVIKSNANQSYATDSETAARFDAVCERAGEKTQRFVTRSDIGCGSTIGPMTAAALGVRTVDVGLPMLSMHSCRELAGASDVPSFAKVLTAFFEA